MGKTHMKISYTSFEHIYAHVQARKEEKKKKKKKRYEKRSILST